MRTVILRGLRAHWLRLLLTSTAIVMGVAFVTGSFILTDTLRGLFDQLARDVAAPVDVSVRHAEFEANDSSSPLLPGDLLEVVRGVDGVAAASGDVGGPAIVQTASGELIRSNTGPFLLFGYTADDVSTFSIEGEAPVEGRVALDAQSISDGGLAYGDEVLLRGLDETVTVTLSGTVIFAGEQSAGARFALVTPQLAQELYGYGNAYFNLSIKADDGLSGEQLARRLNEILPDDVIAVSGDVLEDEFSESFAFIDIFGSVLLGFAGIAVFVSAFIINNTFSIVVGQRIRELGLLRAVGASSRQVRAAVLGEALAVSSVASLLGLAAGIGVANVLQSIIASAGAGLPDGSTVFAPRTVVVGLLVGIGVTVASALGPARMASRLTPVAALRDETGAREAPLGRRIVVGAVATFLGLSLIALGLFGQASGAGGVLGRLIPGALLVFLGVTALSPLAVGPVTGVGARIARSVMGRLGMSNASRNSRRTATTAAALMIGLALVGMATVVGESLRRTFVGTLDNVVLADYFAYDENGGFGPGFSSRFAEELRALPELAVVADYRFGSMEVLTDTGFDGKDVVGTQEDRFGELLDMDFTNGSTEGLDDDGVVLHSDSAEDLGVAPGDTITVKFGVLDDEHVLTVRGVFEDASILGNWVIGLETFKAVFPPGQQGDQFVAALRAPDVTVEQAATAVAPVIDRYPEITFQDRTEFKQSQEDQLDQTLVIINAFLFLSIVIALLGITNTMALSVFERTRELGLLRAVGTTRRQAKRMIRWESVIIAVFGALVGIVVGVVFGVMISIALPETVVATVGVPVGRLVTLLVAAALAGVLASVFPARRAAKLDVLSAISYE